MTLALLDGVFAPAAIIAALFSAGSFDNPRYDARASVPAVHLVVVNAPAQAVITPG
jgi:hypothetical protein